LVPPVGCQLSVTAVRQGGFCSSRMCRVSSLLAPWVLGGWFGSVCLLADGSLGLGFPLRGCCWSPFCACWCGALELWALDGSHPWWKMVDAGTNRRGRRPMPSPRVFLS